MVNKVKLIYSNQFVHSLFSSWLSSTMTMPDFSMTFLQKTLEHLQMRTMVLVESNKKTNQAHDILQAGV